MSDIESWTHVDICDIFQYRELTGDETDTQREVGDATSDADRDEEKKIVAKREVEIILVNAFQHLNSEMRTVYKELDKNMKRVLIEAEPACNDVIDGSRHDLTELLSTIMSPSFADVREHTMHELFRLTCVLKEAIENI